MAEKKKTGKKETAPKKKSVAKTRKAKAKSNNNEEKALTAQEIDEFRLLLWEKRRELLSNVDQMCEETLDTNRKEASGELSNMPIHMADVGTDNYEQEFTLGLIDSERKMLRDIDRALNKIEKGGYGICEGTEKQISRARLKAAPEARYCIEYAKQIELGLVTPNKNDLIPG